MGILESGTGVRVVLVPAQIVGRSRKARLRLENTAVSAEHATLRFANGRWVVRDLGSRNGTWVHGRRLSGGSWHELREGDCLQFASSDERWWLVDASAPRAAATSGTCHVEDESGLLLLPSADAPEIVIAWSTAGWRIDRRGVWVPVSDGQEIEVAGRRWTLSLPDIGTADNATETTCADETLLESFVLEFRVSLNEETVELALVSDGRRIVLPERAHHYLLLVLARERLGAVGEESWSAGWIARERLLRLIGATPEALNVDIHRARRQLANLGLKDAANIIERRHGAAEIRLGTDRVTIHAHEVPASCRERAPRSAEVADGGLPAMGGRVEP